MRQWLCLAGAIGSEVGGTLALRAANDHPAWIAPVVVGYTLSFALLAVVLRAGMPIGVAYGIWAASGVTLTALLAALLFGDPLTWVMGLGFVVVVAGVLLVEIGSHRGEAWHDGPEATR
ncbi:DMT family transporter [Micromonospora sp. CPCC 205561]|uniref:DMT family transporter n=1 Tax=Micromonospora sp. CPCC 205561 TaxID=3122407 RepID=UPI002FF07FB4